MNLQLLTILIVFILILISATYITQTAGYKKDLSGIPSTTAPTTTPNASIQITPAPGIEPSNNSTGDFLDFKYPNSLVKSENDGVLVLISNDNSQLITNWYKQKIKSVGMNVTSFIQTSTNGSVLNKLVGSDGKKKIQVEITKIQNLQEVKIELNVNK